MLIDSTTQSPFATFSFARFASMRGDVTVSIGDAMVLMTARMTGLSPIEYNNNAVSHIFNLYLAVVHQ
jgi:hypothetical protein